MKFKIIICIGIAWMIAIICLIFYANTQKPSDTEAISKPTATTSQTSSTTNQTPSTSVSTSASPTANNRIGTDYTKIIEKDAIGDRISLFFTLINEGKLDGAVTLVDPNTMMVIISMQKDKAPNEVMFNYVRLFEKGSLEKVNLPKISEGQDEPLEVKVTLDLKGNKKLNLTLDMATNVLDNANSKAEWFIKGITRNQ